MVVVEIIIYLKAYSPWPRWCCRFRGCTDQRSIVLINIAVQDYIPFAGSLHHSLYIRGGIT